MNEPANFDTNKDAPWNWEDQRPGEPKWNLKCDMTNRYENPPYKTSTSNPSDLVPQWQYYRVVPSCLQRHATCTRGCITYQTKLYVWSAFRASRMSICTTTSTICMAGVSLSRRWRMYQLPHLVPASSPRPSLLTSYQPPYDLIPLVCDLE